MKNIVLCGSMKVKDSILAIAKDLEEKGYNVLLPIECINGLPKNEASRAHFERIINKDNEYVLIVNEEKNGIENYIGPNSFAEIAFAYFYNKKVYLLNDMYEPYQDELIGWNIKTLNGNIDNID